MLRQLRLKNFRCFEDHTLLFDKTTVVVGKNNAGKSTLIEALQILSLVVNRKGANFIPPPQWLEISKFRTCIAPKLSPLDFNLKTIFHRYGEPPAEITGTFGDGVTVTVYLGQEERAYGFVRKGDKWINSPAQLVNLRLPWIYILPQVGPLQPLEPLLNEDYTNENLYSRLSSRHFRNQIFRNRDQFSEFKSLAEHTWHGLQVKPVEREMTKDGELLSMQVRDGDFVAEVGSMGHGLQLWLQTIWFVSRTPAEGTIVLDEPDVYMHPDLQRKLFRLVNGRFSQAILATHSVEIMAETEPDNILIVDKRRRRSHYANSEPGVQLLIDQLGGIHNVHLARLFSARKFLFVEGKDLSLLRHFHSLLFPEAENPLDALPNVSIGGWGGWSYVVGSSMTLKNAVGERITCYCLLDSDYHTPKEIQERYREATVRGIELHIWSRKEIENYLLYPSPIKRAIAQKTEVDEPPSEKEIQEKMLRLCDREKDTVLDAISDAIRAENRELTPGGANKAARHYMESAWSEAEGRLGLVSGKKIFSKLSEWSQRHYGASLGHATIARKFRRNEIPEEVITVLEAIEEGTSFPQKTSG